MKDATRFWIRMNTTDDLTWLENKVFKFRSLLDQRYAGSFRRRNAIMSNYTYSILL